MTSTATQTIPECAPWCAYQDDPEFFAGEEGDCLGVELRTELSIPQSDPDDLPVGEADYLTAYLVRRPEDRPDAIVLGHGQLAGIELTAVEAREVIEHLQLLLGQIGGAA